jgi:hypothetical protein
MLAVHGIEGEGVGQDDARDIRIVEDELNERSEPAFG